MNSLTSTGSQLPIFYYRPQSSTLRQKLFRSVFGPAGVMPECDEGVADCARASQDSPDEATGNDEETKPRHRGFTLPSPAKLNTEIGRQIGYDYAMAALQPPESAPLAFEEGFRSGRSKRSHKTPYADRFERKVLRLRYSAWRRNRLFDPKVTAQYLATLYRKFCPITRISMTSGTGQDTDASVERVFNCAAYAVGNLAFMSAKANWAKANRTLDELVAIVEAETDTEGFSCAGWQRLAALSNMFQPDISDMHAMPMCVLPPTGLFVNNPTVILQEAISSISSGWESPQLQTTFRTVTPGKHGKRTFDGLVELLRGAILRELKSSRQLTLAWTLENAWQQPGIFEQFMSWYCELSPSNICNLLDVNARLRPQVIARASGEPLASWGLATRGYDREDELCDERTSLV